MAGPSIPEKFRKAKTDIDNYVGDADSPFDVVLASWPQQERVEFATWYSNDKTEERAKSVKAQMEKPAMTMKEYLDRLKAVDFQSVDSIISFSDATQVRDREPFPQPVLLGRDDRSDLVFQLSSQLVDDMLPRKSELPSNVPPSDFIIEVKATAADVQSPVQFVFPLGNLTATPSSSPTTPGIDTPYRVCINPVDRSIWLIMVDYTLDSNGGRVPIPKDADTWALMGGASSKGRKPFDVIKVATADALFALNQTSGATRVMFSDQEVEKSRRVFPKPVRPSAAAVEQALKK